MSHRPQTKWIVGVKDNTGKLSTVILRFEPKIGQVLEDGRVVVKVN